MHSKETLILNKFENYIKKYGMNEAIERVKKIKKTSLKMARKVKNDRKERILHIREASVCRRIIINSKNLMVNKV